jgi:hypothetical protein
MFLVYFSRLEFDMKKMVWVVHLPLLIYTISFEELRSFFFLFFQRKLIEETIQLLFQFIFFNRMFLLFSKILSFLHFFSVNKITHIQVKTNKDAYYFLEQLSDHPKGHCKNSIRIWKRETFLFIQIKTFFTNSNLCVNQRNLLYKYFILTFD